MAKRSLPTNVWRHPAMEDWLSDRRALYCALLADPGASFCGCWRIQPASVAVDAGLSRQKVEALAAMERDDDQ